MTGDLFQHVGDLKESARGLMRSGDYSAALDALSDAVTLLLDAHEQSGTSGAIDAGDVRRELAACYGILGNIFRRMGDPVQALAMFKRGAAYEDDVCENRTNAIILTLMMHPEQLDAIRPSVLEARAILQGQVADARRDDIWAWSDLGVMRLLSGQHEPGRAAFERVVALGAAPAARASIERLLGVLSEALADSAPETAQAIGVARRVLESA